MKNIEKIMLVLVVLFALTAIYNIATAQSATFVDSMISINHNYKKIAIYSDYGTDFYTIEENSERSYFSPSLFPLYAHHTSTNTKKLIVAVDSIPTSILVVETAKELQMKFAVDTLVQIYTHKDSIQSDCKDCIEYQNSISKHNKIIIENGKMLFYQHVDSIIYTQKTVAKKASNKQNKKVSKLKKLLWKQNAINKKLSASSSLHEITYSFCQHDFKIKPLLKIIGIGYILHTIVQSRELALRTIVLQNKAKIKALQAEIRNEKTLARLN